MSEDTQVTIYFVSGEKVSLKGLEADEFLRQYYGSEKFPQRTEMITLEKREWLPDQQKHVWTRQSFHKNNFEQVHSSEYY